MSKSIERRVITGVVVERKVATGSTAATVTAFVVYLLARYVLHAEVPDVLVGVIGSLVTGLITLVTGWMSRHTARVTDGR